jgi:F0F1-type ATP synthase assembly protein I
MKASSNLIAGIVQWVGIGIFLFAFLCMIF